MTRNPGMALLVMLLALGAAVSCRMAGKPAAPEAQPGRDPLNSSYSIEGEHIRLAEGRCERVYLPGAATKAVTRVWRTPVSGDLDGDGDEDAALVLIHAPGGSGTFYYVAAALQQNGAYLGSAAVLLGDRIAPLNLRISNGVILVDYADRRPDEPMAAVPSERKTRPLGWERGELVELPPLASDELVVEGWATIGHEVRSIQTCSAPEELWLSGDSPALKDILAAYARALPDARPYTPLFMVLAGRPVERPAEGFGAAYPGGFLATRHIKTWPRGNCRSEFIVIDTPAPGTLVSSPLTVRGRARGNWFFEGDFPLLLKDARGDVLARGYATAQGEWMTTGFVPFEGRLDFARPVGGDRGTLVLQKHNPTDLPQHDDAAEIPVFFR